MDILLGLQWGDEGKGKIVDFLAPRYDIIARFQGGPNAGHTLVFGGKKHVLHQIPSGVFQSGTLNVIGNGVVLDLAILKNEIAKLEAAGFDVRSRLVISKKAHVILPSHRMLDAASEAHKGDNKIGSTLKGIGPAYQDKAGRYGLRAGDLTTGAFEAKYREITDRHRSLLDFYGHKGDWEEAERSFFEGIEFVAGLKLADTEYLLNNAAAEGKKILAEGAQGTLLDVDFGSYPFVTSSSTSAAGACTGLGIAPSGIRHSYGIFKAYCTRVGSGPFPTELDGEEGRRLQEAGNEFGSTTGRPRRCGWLDLPALKYAIMLNGTTHLMMMKTDVLNGFDQVRICTGYRLADGSIVDQMPYDLCHTETIPVYRNFNGWSSTEDYSKGIVGLSKPLRDYIGFIEQQAGVPIALVSFGPDREETVINNL